MAPLLGGHGWLASAFASSVCTGPSRPLYPSLHRDPSTCGSPLDVCGTYRRRDTTEVLRTEEAAKERGLTAEPPAGGGGKGIMGAGVGSEDE